MFCAHCFHTHSKEHALYHTHSNASAQCMLLHKMCLYDKGVFWGVGWGVGRGVVVVQTSCQGTEVTC